MANSEFTKFHSRAYRKDWFGRMEAQPLWDSWSTKLYPRNLEDALYWGNWMRTRYGDVVAAITRGVCYFLNGVDLNNEIKDMDSRQHYTDLLINKHKINTQLLDVALNLEFYGNSFTSITQPITRVLRCKHCGQRRYLKALTRGYDYDFTGGEFVTTCPGCRKTGPADVIDLIDPYSHRPLNVIHWNPLSMSIDHCSLSGAERMIYSPTDKDRTFINDEASSVTLETLPKTLLDTIVNNRQLKFNDNACLHLAMPTDCMSVDEMGGWGLPPFLPSFRYVIMMMLLDRQTEAAIKDFILPIRLLFPDPSSAKGGSDPVMGTNLLHMGNLRSSIERALKAQAYQQSSWQMVPAPVGQLQLGGDGKAIVPVDVLQFAKSQLLDSLGVPAELFQASLNAGQGATNALKMFEQTRARRVTLYDDYLNWYLKRCSEFLQWPDMTGIVVRPSIQTSPERMQMMSMLQQAGQVSLQTLCREMGIDPDQERIRIREEAVRNAEDQARIQRQISRSDAINALQTIGGQVNLENAIGAAQAQAMQTDPNAPPPQGGDPSQGGGAPMPPQGAAGMGGDPISQIQGLRSMMAPESATPDQLNADADAVANILLHTPPGVPRNQIYQMVKERNQTLYDIANSKLEKLENQAKQQGVDMARQGQI